MSTSAAVRGVCHAALASSTFGQAQFSAAGTSKWPPKDRAEQIRQVLKQAGVTMAQVSAETSMRYGKTSPYFIPPTFLYKQKNGITPHICQVAALSEVTAYRFADWMSVCGFDLNLIFALQLKIHTERTVLVTPGHAVAACRSSYVGWQSKLQKSNGRYFFAKIGSRDAVVYPRLVPGSIVRADRHYSPRVLNRTAGDDLLWLVEHPAGLTCCHVKRVDNAHIVLLPSRPPLSVWPLLLSTEARILGLVDLELRPREAAPFEPMRHPAKCDPSPVASFRKNRMSFSDLLRLSRARTGLTLRAAHEKTMIVARLLRNRDYGIALGLLSDYEATNKLPRHVAKIMSLCIVYGIDPWELMEASGINIDDSDKVPLFSQGRKSDLPANALRAQECG